MYNTYNYIQILRKQTLGQKINSNLKILFFFTLKTSNKLNIILNFLLLKNILKTNNFKINIRKNIIYFTFNNLLLENEWLKYFLKHKHIKKKLKKIPTLFFLYDLKLLTNYRKINYNLFFYNINYNSFLAKFYSLYK